jgi:hypothetical protein
MSIKEKLAGKRVYLKRIKQLSHISNIVHSYIYRKASQTVLLASLSVHFFGIFAGKCPTKIA